MAFPTPPLFDADAQCNPSEFLAETYLTKLEGWGYCTVKIA